MSEEDQAGQRKRMRKGTHSCTGCRERKVKCVFSSGAAKCDECSSRGKSCLDQETVRATSSVHDPNKSTKEWLSEIDDKVVQILKTLQGLPEHSSLAGLRPSTDENLLDRLHLETIRSTAPLAESFRDGVDFTSTATLAGTYVATLQSDSDRAPLLSLIDNAILQAEKGRTTNDFENRRRNSFPMVTNEMNRLLRLLIPSDADLAAIIQATRCWWELWGDLSLDDVPGEMPRGEISDKILQFVRKAFQNGDLAALIKLLFSLAICIQQLPRDFEFSTTTLSPPPHNIQIQCLSAAESMLSTNQALCNTIDGLECMLIQVKFYVNMGKPRAAWLICQRGISVCRANGINGLSEYLKDPFQRRWQIAYQDYWSRDRQLSLLLGLPCSNSGDQPNMLDMRGINNDNERAQAFWTNLGILAGHIIDRNQNASRRDLSVTLDIEQKIQYLKEAMPIGWWQSEPNSQQPVAYLRNHYLSKFVFYNTRKLLHLPFMLKAMTEPVFEYSRDIALDASRQMIRIYEILRSSEYPLVSICNAEDFQAFTAVLVLVVYLLGPGASNTQSSSYGVYHDWDLVRRISKVFQHVALERGCSVAVQAHRLLEDVLEARHDFPATEDGAYHASIPYFGKISLKRRFAASTEGGLSSVDPRTSSTTHSFQISDIKSPNFTLAEVTELSSENSFAWSAAGQDWPLVGDDFNIDWNDFRQ